MYTNTFQLSQYHSYKTSLVVFTTRCILCKYATLIVLSIICSTWLMYLLVELPSGLLMDVALRLLILQIMCLHLLYYMYLLGIVS